MRLRRLGLPAVLLIVVGTGCRPSGRTVITSRYVSPASSERVIITGRVEEYGPDRTYSEIPAIAGAADGWLYLLDPDSWELIAYSPGSVERFTVGGHGLSRASLTSYGSLALVGTRIVVNPFDSTMLKVWHRLTGDFIGEIPAPRKGVTLTVAGVSDNTLLQVRSLDPGALSRFAVDLVRIDEGTVTRTISVEPRPMPTARTERLAIPLTDLAQLVQPVIANDRIYYLAASGYRIFGHHLDLRPSSEIVGEGWPRLPFDVDKVSKIVSTVGRYARELEVDYEWPEFFPVIDTLRADAAGRLWVFPFVPDSIMSNDPTLRPVDVYGGDADPLYARTSLPPNALLTSAGEHSYGVLWDPGPEAFRLVRVEPIIPN